MRKCKKITIPLITEDLAYLCGVLVGDGSIAIREQKNEYLVNCGGNPRDEVEFYKEVVVPLFKKLFDIDTKAKLLGTTYGVNIYSKNLVDFLLKEIGLPRSPKNKISIPLPFRTNKRLLLSFIAGVADTDFSFKLRNGNYPIISGCSNDQMIMAEISQVLEQEGFKIVRTFNYKVKDHRIQRGYTIIHRIDINGHKAFTQWIALIGTRHPKNWRRISLWREANPKRAQEINYIKKVAEGGFEPPTLTPRFAQVWVSKTDYPMSPSGTPGCPTPLCLW